MLLLALLAGYTAFGIVFTHHIHTHDYYSLPIVLAVALGVGALVDRLATLLPAQWWSSAAAAVVSLGCLTAGSVAVLESQRSERKAALRAEAARYERIGRMVGHSTRVLVLDGAYGLPLAYHGFMLAATWPLSIDVAVMSLTGGSIGPADERLEASGARLFCVHPPDGIGCATGLAGGARPAASARGARRRSRAVGLRRV